MEPKVVQLEKRLQNPDREIFPRKQGSKVSAYQTRCLELLEAEERSHPGFKVTMSIDQNSKTVTFSYTKINAEVTLLEKRFNETKKRMRGWL